MTSHTFRITMKKSVESSIDVEAEQFYTREGFIVFEDNVYNGSGNQVAAFGVEHVERVQRLAKEAA